MVVPGVAHDRQHHYLCGVGESLYRPGEGQLIDEPVAVNDPDRQQCGCWLLLLDEAAEEGSVPVGLAPGLVER
ncbi:MAG: hypothetical protein ACLPN6_30830 [Streptosporangiaceae bacterium]